MEHRYFFAVDLGATSGRTILGSLEQGKLKLEEVNRFPNKITEKEGHFYWDLDALFNSILEGLSLVAQRNIQIQSIGIDTWGVDIVLFDGNGKKLGQPYSYRDPHTAGMQEKFFEKIARENVYASTGIQFMDFNTLFQLTALREKEPEYLNKASKVLFMPDALSYLLTGNMVTEYTIASTSQMLDARNRKFNSSYFEALNLKNDLFPLIVQPGSTIGYLSSEVQALTGLGAVPVIAVAGHDTASAVASVPAKDKEFAYLSSGTWSLMGIENNEPILTEDSFRENFTNEGGVENTIRFLKNICGMWLLERCRNEWGTDDERNSYPNLIAESRKVEAFRSFINPDHPMFANPESMVQAIRQYCAQTSQIVPESKAEITRLIFESLAMRYKQVFGVLQGFSDTALKILHVIGGGSRNDMLNQFTSNALGIPVLAGPMEATALGNVLIQARAAGMFDSLDSMRKTISESVSPQSFTPQDTQAWENAFANYLNVYIDKN